MNFDTFHEPSASDENISGSGLIPAMEGEADSLLREKTPTKRNIVAYFSKSRDFSTLHMHWDALEEIGYLNHAQLTTVLKGLRRLLKEADNPILSHSFVKGNELVKWFDKFDKLENVEPRLLKDNWHNFTEMMLVPDLNFSRSTWELDDYSSLTPRDIAYLWHAQATLGVVPPRVHMEKMVRALGPRLNDFDADSLGRVAWSVAVFGAISGSDEFRAVAKILLDLTNDEEMSRSSHYRRNVTSIFFGLGEHALAAHQQGEDKPSNWEFKLKMDFRAAGCDILPDSETHIAQLGRKFDIGLKHDGRNIIIEADGPYHRVYDFNTGLTGFDGATQVITAVLERLYPDAIILRIKAEDFKKYLGPDMKGQRELVETITQTFNELAPGSYKTKLTGPCISLLPFFVTAADPVAYPLIPFSKRETAPIQPDKPPETSSGFIGSLWKRACDFLRPTGP